MSILARVLITHRLSKCICPYRKCMTTRFFVLTSDFPATDLFVSGLKATTNAATRLIVATATKSANRVFFLCRAE